MTLEIAAAALACGAAEFGGPLSAAELRLVKSSGAGTRSQGRALVAAIRDGGDPLGEMLCAARSAAERRRLGTFYTSDTIVMPMLDWVFEGRPARLVDPGCGSGRFAVAAARRRRDLEIIAVDIDPASTLATRAALRAVGARNARVLQQDYLGAPLPRASGRTAFTGNPPYVRHHELSHAMKMRARELAAALGLRLSGLCGLHVLFYLATLALHARDGDVGSFVTSAQWLDVAYGALLRSAFAGPLGGEAIALFDSRTLPFEDAMTTAAVTAFTIGAAPRFVRCTRIDCAPFDFSLSGGARVQRAALATAARWSAAIAGSLPLESRTALGSLFRVSRGQVTGANGFFVMSKTQARERGLTEFCVPLIASAREIIEAQGIVRDGADRSVGLSVPAGTDCSKHAALGAYLREGEAAGANLGYIASRRRPWYAVTFPSAPVVATYMARQPPVFARNPDGLGLLNVVHGLHPLAAADDAALDHIVGALNAERASFAGRGRLYQGGLEKFEPREMEALPLPLPA